MAEAHPNELLDQSNELSIGISEVADITGISAFTIRYYDKCGFFPGLQRGKRGIRTFTARDVRQLKLVDALRRSGLSIDGIRYYVKLMKADGRTAKDREAILQSQAVNLEYQIAEAQESLQFLKEELKSLKYAQEPERDSPISAVYDQTADITAKAMSKQSSKG